MGSHMPAIGQEGHRVVLPACQDFNHHHDGGDQYNQLNTPFILLIRPGESAGLATGECSSMVGCVHKLNPEEMIPEIYPPLVF